MNLSQKTIYITLNTLPILLMIGLIPVIPDDYWLTGAYLLITIISLVIHYEKDDWKVYLFGLIALTISEYIFLTTGVEQFLRVSLLGVMPLWLPFLWAYAFIAMKRGILNILQ